MFMLFENNSIYSPIAGRCLDIVECEDPVFASRMMGDGFLIEPTEQRVVAPCDGIIKTIFPTKHAVCLEMKSGQNILIHIGIDTMKLSGEGFNSQLNVGDKVQRGDLLVEFDLKHIQSKGIKIPIIVVLLENKIDHVKDHLNQMIKSGALIIKL